MLAFTLSNCQVEEDLVKQEGSIKTVSLNEAISFLKQNPVKTNSIAAKKKPVLLDLAHITQEEITNSDQLITVIPFSDNNKQEYSRVLLLKVKNELRSTVFSIYPDTDDKVTDFSRKIILRNLNGDFVNGFRVKNGYIISQYEKKNTTNITNRSTAIELEEVVIPIHKRLFNMNTAFLFPEDAYGGSNYNENFWNPEYPIGGGGDPVSCQPGYIQDEYGDCVLDDQIINELTGKEKYLNDLLDKNGDSFVKKIIG